MDRSDTVIAYFAPREVLLSQKLILNTGYDVLILKYLPHDVAWRVLKEFLRKYGYDYTVITVDDVLVYGDNVRLMEEAHDILGDKVISALMTMGMGLAVNEVWFSVTDKVLTRRPLTYRDYSLWNIETVNRKLREGRFHKVFYTGFGFTLMPSKVVELLPCEGMVRVPQRWMGRLIRKVQQIDVRHSIELHKRGIEHYVDLMNVVNHLGNLRALVPRHRVPYGVVLVEKGKVIYDLSGEFPIEDWTKEILVGRS